MQRIMNVKRQHRSHRCSGGYNRRFGKSNRALRAEARGLLTTQGPQGHDFSRGSRTFPLPGGVATRMVVSPSCYDVSVGYRPTNKTVYLAKYHYVKNWRQVA